MYVVASPPLTLRPKQRNTRLAFIHLEDCLVKAQKCSKTQERAEFTRLVKAVGVGVMFMGCSGVCIKLAGAHFFRRNY